MAAKYGVVYATGSKMIRRIIVTDDESSLDKRHIGRGESLLVADKSGGTSLDTARAAVKAATGVDPPDPQCAVVDGDGQVVNVIKADPEIDRVDGLLLVSAPPTLAIGATYDSNSGTFSEPVTAAPGPSAGKVDPSTGDGR